VLSVTRVSHERRVSNLVPGFAGNQIGRQSATWFPANSVRRTELMTVRLKARYRRSLMARCLLPDGRCGRIGTPCRSGQCIARTLRRLHDRRWRDKLGLFFVEGEDAVEAATAEPVDLLRAGEDVEPKLLAEVASAPHPPRVVGVYRRSDLPGWQDRDATLALWRLADPGNVGTLIRTADAFGAAGALSDGCADPTSPKALRASAGSIWRVPIGAWDRIGGTRVALEAHRGRALDEVDLSGRVTFLLGAEREGLPPDLERDVDATIPITGAESLNVAATGAIALYDLARRRS
jgi:TrmH family RNA methyltransferase